MNGGVAILSIREARSERAFVHYLDVRRGMLQLQRFRMLVVGSQIPFRDAYDLSPNRALKWIQRPLMLEKAASTVRTIVGTSEPLPLGEWELFTREIENSGILKMQGNPDYLAAGFHQPTWLIGIETSHAVKHIKAYGVGELRAISSTERQNSDAWAVALAVAAVDLLSSRIPWTERLVTETVSFDAFADLVQVGSA